MFSSWLLIAVDIAQEWKLGPPAVESWSPNHWIARELPFNAIFFFKKIKLIPKKSRTGKISQFKIKTRIQPCTQVTLSAVLCLAASDSVTPELLALKAPLSIGILQARILEWVAMPFSTGLPQSRDRTQVSHIVGVFFTC